MRVLGNKSKGLLFVISAPAGSGKTTLVAKLREEFPNEVQQTVSCTTREAREGEEHGSHYHFISKEDFEQKESLNEFLESAKVFTDHYGTLETDVEAIRDSGKHALLVIDTQGALSVRMKTDAVLIFIEPPSLSELKARLQKRNTETEESLTHRLSWAEKEIAKSSEYDYRIVNDDLDIAYQVLRSIIIAEEHANH